ncbi:T9SS C-terminal target domain-containing protein, partial [candidate division KSB1 bacterium]
MLRKFSLLFLWFPILALAQDRPIVNVFDADIGPGQNVTWTADNIYLLNGFVFVEDGAMLTIEAGTVIKGKPGQGENSSALIIARGAKIFANGTATNPIIFTAEADDVNDLNDLPLDARGLWGGVIILGKAVINVAG